MSARLRMREFLSERPSRSQVQNHALQHHELAPLGPRASPGAAVGRRRDPAKFAKVFGTRRLSPRRPCG